MVRKPQGSAGGRLAATDDLEISSYVEIGRDRSRGQSHPSEDLPSVNLETILIIDFGSQYSRLIARRVRESSVYCEIIPYDTPWEKVAPLNPKGVILSGGPSSVYEAEAPLAPDWVFSMQLPVLGICYGMQLLAHQLGGTVVPSPKREYGHALLHQGTGSHPLFSGMQKSVPVWMSHGDRITQLPPGFQSLAYTENSPIAVMGNEQGIIGIQFHPEVAHTPQGKDLLENFLYRICGCQGTWTPGNVIAESVARVKDTAGRGQVICALSGGVDSAVTAALVHRAIGDRLTCIFVNNGLLRKEESERVLFTLQENMGVKVVHVDAEARFLSALSGITDPEEKRKAIGREFINVFDEEAAKLGMVHFLAQGTLYPDVIESQDSTVSAKIKTHHNVGGLPEDMKLNLIEPLRYLFKDEVRQVGLALGLPEEMIYRQPFPGPGLAIRIIGDVTKAKLDVLRECDWIVMDEIKGADLYRELWQSFAVLTDTLSVGVMGDHRTYAHVVAIRAVSSDDAMTADWARLPYEVLGHISNRIINEVPEVNRVVYDITSKPPGTIEWE